MCSARQHVCLVPSQACSIIPTKSNSDRNSGSMTGLFDLKVLCCVCLFHCEIVYIITSHFNVLLDFCTFFYRFERSSDFAMKSTSHRRSFAHFSLPFRAEQHAGPFVRYSEESLREQAIFGNWLPRTPVKGSEMHSYRRHNHNRVSFK